jgi:predicted N-acyltransferase
MTTTAQTALTARLLGSIDEIAPATWDAMLVADASPFIEHAFLSSLEAAGCVGAEAGWLPRHIAIFRGETLVGAAPAYLKGNSEGEFVFDWQWADLAVRMGVEWYPKLVVAVPFTPATGQRILVAPGEDVAAVHAAIAAAIRAIVEQLELSSAHVLFPLRGELEALERQGFATRYGVQFHWHDQNYRDFDGWLSSLGSKKKHQIRRERRLVREAGVTIRTLRGAELDDEAIAFAYRIYLSTVDKFVWGRRYLNQRFFTMIRDRWAGSDRADAANPTSGALELVVAEREGRRIAGAVNIAKNGRLYGRYWGAIEEVPHLHFDVCYYHSIDDCLRRGLHTFEPGAGGEHKARRGFAPTMTTSAHLLRDRRIDRVIREFLGRERAHVEQICAGEVEPEE